MRQGFRTALGVSLLNSPALAQQQPTTAVPVGVAKAERRPIGQSGEYVGRVEAVSRVEIRARLTGFLETVPQRRRPDQGRRAVVPDRKGIVRGTGPASRGRPGAK